MAKKKDKATESKKPKTEKPEPVTKGGSLSEIKATPVSKHETKGSTLVTGQKSQTVIEKIKSNKIVIAGVAVLAAGIIGFTSLSMETASTTPDKEAASLSLTKTAEPSRATSEAAAANILPAALAPKKTQLAETQSAKPEPVVSKAKVEKSKKSASLNDKAKSKSTVKKMAANSIHKSKASLAKAKHDKKVKKTLAAKTMD